MKSRYTIYRDQFPITKKYIFMNHAAVSALPRRVVEAVSSLLEELSCSSSIGYSEWVGKIEEVRALVGKIINSKPSEIAFVTNTSEGLSSVATGFKWKNGDAVLIPEPEFPANIYPWMNLERSGVMVTFVERREGRLETKDFSKALDKRTRMIAVSSVDFVTGFHIDLEELGDFCRKKGIILCVDAIQSLGIIPMDVKKYGIHFLAAGAHKWLLGLMGSGFLYVSDDVNNEIEPKRVGWKSVVHEEEFHKISFQLKPDALRFESGTMNLAGIYALGASLDLLMEVGIKNIQETVFALNDEFYSGFKKRTFNVITPMGEGERSGIFSFVPAGDPERFFKYLTSENVLVSLRNGVIRISPHFYNTEHEIKRFFEILDEFK